MEGRTAPKLEDVLRALVERGLVPDDMLEAAKAARTSVELDTVDLEDTQSEMDSTVAPSTPLHSECDAFDSLASPAAGDATPQSAEVLRQQARALLETAARNGSLATLLSGSGVPEAVEALVETEAVRQRVAARLERAAHDGTLSQRLAGGKLEQLAKKIQACQQRQLQAAAPISGNAPSSSSSASGLGTSRRARANRARRLEQRASSSADVVEDTRSLDDLLRDLGETPARSTLVASKAKRKTLQPVPEPPCSDRSPSCDETDGSPGVADALLAPVEGNLEAARLEALSAPPIAGHLGEPAPDVCHGGYGSEAFQASISELPERDLLPTVPWQRVSSDDEKSQADSQSGAPLPVWPSTPEFTPPGSPRQGGRCLQGPGQVFVPVPLSRLVEVQQLLSRPPA
eukprot:TRINITY_DN18905_c0_g1_i1.p1 TRINITY_DN18905_c0_g1~~TRINITY_DN18905_c0_g1_i1.p1  ORF type:complete len:402 (+),score=81.14 TRINITY_DN18905_c0_g1_i1:107-1312(+)